MVLPILVYALTGSPALTAFLTAIEVLPYLLFGLLAGAVADRLDRRRIMVSSDLVNTALLGSIPVASVLGVLTVAQVYVVAFASALAFVWFDAAEFGALPALVGRDRVMSANSIVIGSSTAMAVIGPSVAGVLAATIGPAYAVAIDAGSYFVSAVLLLSVSRPFQMGAAGRDQPAGESVLRRTLREISEGLRFLWRERLVRAMTLAVFGMTATGGAALGLLVVYGVRALGLPRQDARIGLLFTAGAVGSLIATLVLPRIGRRLPAGRVALLALAVNVPALVVLALVQNLVSALALLVVYQGTYTLGVITGISLRQFVTPDHLQGRVNATGGWWRGAASRWGRCSAECWPTLPTSVPRC